MKVIFTCGGTAGHVNPALALAAYLQKKDPNTQVMFVGTPRGIEKKLVAAAGYDGWYTLENPVGDTYTDSIRQVAVLKYWLKQVK